MAYSVEVRVDTFADDVIPHTFIVLTDENGNKRGYGFAPETSHSLQGNGKIFDDTDHKYSATTGKIPLTQEQYQNMINYINESTANPPQYNLFFGSHCATWALNVLDKGNINSLVTPSLDPENIVTDVSQTVIFNPYTQYLNIKINQIFSKASAAYSQTKADFNNSVDKFKNSINDFVRDAKGAANEFSKDAQESWNKFNQASQEIYNDMVNNASEKIEDAADFAQKMSQKLQDAAKSLEQDLKDAGEAASNVAKDLAKRVQQAAEDLAKAAKEAYERVKSAAEQAAEAARDFFDNLPDINDLFDKFKDLLPNQEDWIDNLPKWAKEWLGLDAKRSGKAHGYDPLILDLGGNGIETISVAGFSGSLFDHNNDGIRTATGWISADDGLLVRDLNGNGLIDNGSELFGNNTRLANGQNAAHGYAALAELDSNNDGKVNALDKAFNELRAWIDANSDGISQVSELHTLMSLDIQSLNLEHQENSKDLGNGNRLTHIGSYTKTDGTTGEMGDVEFASNSLYSRYTDTVELTPEQLQAPNLQGLGRLRDLREAAALNAELADTLKAYAAAQTKEEQTALLSELVTKWGATDPFKSKTDAFTLSSDLILTDNEGIGLTPTQIAEWRKGIVLDAQTTADFSAVRGKIAVLDAFTGEKSETLYFGTPAQARQIIDTVNKTYSSLFEQVYTGLLFQTRLQPYLNELGFNIENSEFKLDYSHVQTKFQETFASNAQKAFVDLGEFLAFGSVKDWTAGMSLLSDFAKQGKESGQLQDWLNILGDKAATILAEQNGDAANNVLQAVGLLGRDVLNGNGGDDRLIVGSATAVVNGGNGSDVYEFNKGFGATTIYNSDTSDKRHDVVRLNGVSKDAISYKRNGNDLIIRVSGEQNSITVSNMFAGDVLTQHIDAIEYDGGQISLTEIKETLLHGTDGNDFLQGYGDDDMVHAGAGNDRIETYNGNDTIYAGLGNDNIDAGGGNDTIHLETGNNRAYGGDGDDTIISGSLNDILEGGMGSDTYIFGKQFGQNTVLNFNPHQHDKDVLKFTHTRLNDVIIHRNEADLLITQKDGQQVTVQNFFEKDGKGDYTVQSIEFADGQQLNTEQLRQWVISPTRGDDKLYAYTDGGKLHGGSGNDTLIGNVGVDYLVGGWGNDTLSGGQNDDRLEGGVGNDTYTFNLGDGNDRIYDSFGNDTLTLGSGIAKQDLWFSRNGRDLTVQVLGQNDSITIEDWYAPIARRIEHIQTEDGAHFGIREVQKMVQAMASFAPQQGSGLSVPEQMKEYSQQVFAANNL